MASVVARPLVIVQNLRHENRPTSNSPIPTCHESLHPTIHHRLCPLQRFQKLTSALRCQPQIRPPDLSRVTGTGHAVSRKPRIPGGGTHKAGQSAMDKEVVAVDGMAAEE
ncbi:hypothetical protein Tco_0986593 [Tanacetum coccineum]